MSTPATPFSMLNDRPRFYSLQPAPPKAFPLETESTQRAFKLKPLDQQEAAGSSNQLSETQRAFAEVLAIADRRPGKTDTIDQPREAAERMVATTLVEPLLKQLRESTNTPPPFGPGPGEKQFRGLGDAFAAREIVRSSRFELVDRLARDMRAHSLSARASQDEDAHSKTDGTAEESAAS